jgi:Cytochrome c554 and c-prime
MRHLPIVRGVILTALALGVTALTSAAPADDGPYAGADACKKCHRAIYDSWSHTKHAHAIDRLQYTDRKKECIGCHVTGTPEMIAAEKDHPSHPNVQCEACHGAAAAHVANAAVRDGLVASPDAESCERCHNEKSPHYKGFVYAAMKRFVHPQ